MGNLTVSEDAQRYTLSQSLCGSGGRLRVMGGVCGATGPAVCGNGGPIDLWLAAVTGVLQPLPHLERDRDLGVVRDGCIGYLSNRPERTVVCTAHIYKRAADSPAALVDVLRLSAPTHAA